MKHIILTLLATLGLAAAAFAIPAHSTYINASAIQDANGSPLASGNFCVVGVRPGGVPTNYQAGGGGQVTIRPSCITVTNGAIPTNTLFVPDSAYTQPANIGYTITITDHTSGKPVIQYVGVQISGTSFNFDAFAPTASGTPAIAPPPPSFGPASLYIGGTLPPYSSVTPPAHSTYINASSIMDANGSPLASGNFCAVGVNNGVPLNYKAGGGGQVTLRPVCITVTNGAIPTNTLFVPDSAYTQPANVGYTLTVVDHTSGKPVIQYIGVNVTGSSWSFDSYIPSGVNLPVQYFTGPPGPPGTFNWRGTWSSGTSYAYSDTVNYNGSSYVALIAGAGHQPDTSPTYWALLVAAPSLSYIQANAQPGADCGAQINAAEAALPSTGGTIDARGYQGTLTCSTAVTFGKPTTLLIDAATLIMTGCPGFTVNAPNVSFRGNGFRDFGNSTSILQSGAACALISNTVESPLHATDGMAIEGLVLEGNSIGTFGVFATSSYNDKIHNVLARNFTSSNIFHLGGILDLHDVTSAGNTGGDCFDLGFDGNFGGVSAANGCHGDGWHIFTGGDGFSGYPSAYLNGLHGAHFDGNNGQDWTAATTYIEQKVICPTSNNAGHFCYFTQVPGTTSGTRPTFCQSPIGCTLSDGSVTWVNIGTGNQYGFGLNTYFSIPYASIILSSINVSNSNARNLSGDWDDILIEGKPTTYGSQMNLSNIQVNQAESDAHAAHGIHVKYMVQTNISNITWYGSVSSAITPADLGGLYLEHDYLPQIGNVNCFASLGPCVSANNSQGVQIGNIIAYDSGNASAANPYALMVDIYGPVTVSQLYAYDDRGTPYQKLVSNGGTTNLFISNQNYAGLAASPVSGTYTYQANGGNGGLYYATSAGPFNVVVAGTQAFAIGSGNLFNFYSPGGSFYSQMSSAASANRSILLPDKSGTVAFTSDITSGVSATIPVSTTCSLTVTNGVITGHSGTGCP